MIKDMELEKIVSTILGKVGNTDVSPQTVKTLISLKPLSEGSEPDDAYIDEMVQAVKSVQGNVNNVFSTKLSEQLERKVDEFKKNFKPEPEPARAPHKGDIPEWALKLQAELEEERSARQKEKAARERKDLLAAVKQGLEDKFKRSGTEANSYFTRSALSRLDIPEEGADVRRLVEQAELLYNQDIKEAGLTPDSPHAGGASGGGRDRVDEHEWDDVAKIVGRDRPQAKE